MTTDSGLRLESPHSQMVTTVAEGVHILSEAAVISQSGSSRFWAEELTADRTFQRGLGPQIALSDQVLDRGPRSRTSFC